MPLLSDYDAFILKVTGLLKEMRSMMWRGGSAEERDAQEGRRAKYKDIGTKLEGLRSRAGPELKTSRR